MATRSVKVYRGVYYTEVSEVRTGETAKSTTLQSLSWDSKSMHKVNPLDNGSITWFFFFFFFFSTSEMDCYFIMRKSGSTSIKGLEKAQNEKRETISYPSSFFFPSLSFSQKSIRQTPEKVSV